jgi:hypothetical protein
MPGGPAGFRQMGRDGTPAACCKTKRPTGSSVCWTCELAHRPGQKLTCRQTLLDECRDVKVRHSTTVHGYSGLLRTCSGGALGGANHLFQISGSCNLLHVVNADQYLSFSLTIIIAQGNRWKKHRASQVSLRGKGYRDLSHIISTLGPYEHSHVAGTPQCIIGR